jgi:hypothetical protein
LTPKRAVCWFLAALLVTGTVLAEEPSKPEKRTKAPTFRFDSKKLAPRVSFELESLSAYRRIAQPGHQQQDHVLFDQLKANVRRDVERLTRQAVKSYLMQAINLDRGIASVKTRIRGEPGEPGERRSSVHYRVGFHGGLPVVGMSYDTGPGVMGLKVGADGAVGVTYRDRRMRQADFSAGFDGKDRFEIRAHLAF